MEDKTRLENVGEDIISKEASWSFGGNVPENFSNHVKRSVPFYEEGHELVCKLSDFFVRDDSTCYELGVSTGALIKGLANKHEHRPNVRWIGIDVEENMIKKAKEQCDNTPNIELLVEDLVSYPLEKSDLIISYYTMQFIPPYVRQEIFNKIYNALNWGGAFIMFEKVRACDARFQDMMQTLYTDFKLEQGYSTQEIVAKTKSLKGVLEPFSTQGNIDLLKRAGFIDMMTIFKYICFEGFLAIK